MHVVEEGGRGDRHAGLRRGRFDGSVSYTCNTVYNVPAAWFKKHQTGCFLLIKKPHSRCHKLGYSRQGVPKRPYDDFFSEFRYF